MLQETREPVGTVINVFNSGASDLLHVELDSNISLSDRNGKQRLEGGASGPLVWVPFVEAIVPTVDLSKREMLITPPKGLLELNIRADERSKKERRQLVSCFFFPISPEFIILTLAVTRFCIYLQLYLIAHPICLIHFSHPISILY